MTTYDINSFEWSPYAGKGTWVLTYRQGMSYTEHPKESNFNVKGHHETRTFSFSSHVGDSYYYRCTQDWDSMMIIIKIT